jgi:hypothetical protein
LEAVLQHPAAEPQRVAVPRGWIGAPNALWNPSTHGIAHRNRRLDAALGRVAWFLGTPLYYRVLVYGRGMLRTRSARLEAIAMETAIVAMIVGAIATGHGTALLQLWVLPAALAILLLALARGAPIGWRSRAERRIA